MQTRERVPAKTHPSPSYHDNHAGYHDNQTQDHHYAQYHHYAQDHHNACPHNNHSTGTVQMRRL